MRFMSVRSRKDKDKDRERDGERKREEAIPVAETASGERGEWEQGREEYEEVEGETFLRERPSGKADNEEEMERALKRVADLGADVDVLEGQVRGLQEEVGALGAEGEPQGRRLWRGLQLGAEGVGEGLMKQLLRLDGLAGDASGDDTVRQARRAQVSRVQRLLDEVDALKDIISALSAGAEDECPASAGAAESEAREGQGLKEEASAGSSEAASAAPCPSDRGHPSHVAADSKADPRGPKVPPPTSVAGQQAHKSPPSTDDDPEERRNAPSGSKDSSSCSNSCKPLGVLKATSAAAKKKEEGRKVKFVNLPDKVPTAEDKPPRMPIQRTRAADVLSSFPKAAVPNAPKRPPPRIRAEVPPASGSGSSSPSPASQPRRTAKEEPPRVQHKAPPTAPADSLSSFIVGPRLHTGAAPGAAPPLGSLQGRGTQGNLSSFGKYTEDDERIRLPKEALKPAVSMEFSTFKPSAVLRTGS